MKSSEGRLASGTGEKRCSSDFDVIRSPSLLCVAYFILDRLFLNGGKGVHTKVYHSPITGPGYVPIPRQQHPLPP